jgi:hypothetical protein
MCVTDTPDGDQLQLSKAHFPDDVVDSAVSVISRLGQQIRTALHRTWRHYYSSRRRKLISQRYSDMPYPLLGYYHKKYHVNFTFWFYTSLCYNNHCIARKHCCSFKLSVLYNHLAKRERNAQWRHNHRLPCLSWSCVSEWCYKEKYEYRK